MERLRKAVVANFGGQYAHLIARRLREAGLYAVLAQPEELEDVLRRGGVAAVVLSGGPRSVLEEEVEVAPAILEAGSPCWAYATAISSWRRCWAEGSRGGPASTATPR